METREALPDTEIEAAMRAMPLEERVPLLEKLRPEFALVCEKFQGGDVERANRIADHLVAYFLALR